jgi:putative toxin-antitoxin system antitoxin component (TIGR02293 family)
MTKLEATISKHVEQRLIGASTMEGLLARELADLGLSAAEIGLTKNEKAENHTGDSPAQSDRLFRTARVTAHAIRVFGSEPKALVWLRAPNDALKDKRPVDLLQSDAGAYAVEEILHRIDFGIFS